jgi:hypothetical protein
VIESSFFPSLLSLCLSLRLSLLALSLELRFAALRLVLRVLTQEAQQNRHFCTLGWTFVTPLFFLHSRERRVSDDATSRGQSLKPRLLSVVPLALDARVLVQVARQLVQQLLALAVLLIYAGREQGYPVALSVSLNELVKTCLRSLATCRTDAKFRLGKNPRYDRVSRVYHTAALGLERKISKYLAQKDSVIDVRVVLALGRRRRRLVRRRRWFFLHDPALRNGAPPVLVAAISSVAHKNLFLLKRHVFNFVRIVKTNLQSETPSFQVFPSGFVVSMSLKTKIKPGCEISLLHHHWGFN